jgi:hypothetical protein
MATAGRILQIFAMVLVIYALFVGVALRSMQGELAYLFVAVGLFFVGWLMGKPKK